MHADLAWELMPDGQAEHALVVTAAGVPGRRRIAERWFRDAPPADETWEYHPARQASLSSQLVMMDLNDTKLDIRKLTFGLHVDSDLVDAVVFHPGFAAMPPEARDHVGYLALDWALGEDNVTRWIGTVETSAARPAGGRPAAGLIETVEALARRAAEPRWALLRGERDGALVLASVALPAKWVDHEPRGPEVSPVRRQRRPRPRGTGSGPRRGLAGRDGEVDPRPRLAGDPPPDGPITRCYEKCLYVSQMTRSVVRVTLPVHIVTSCRVRLSGDPTH